MSDDIQFPMDPSNPTILAFGEPFALHKQKFTAQAIVRPQLMASAEFERVQDQLIDELQYRLTATVLEEKLVEKEHSAEVTAHAVAVAIAEATTEYPSSWWQHFKQDHFPGWMKRRWPVKTHQLRAYRRETATNSNTETVSITFRQYAQFPAAQVRTPRNFRGPVLVAREELTSTTWPEELS